VSVVGRKGVMKSVSETMHIGRSNASSSASSYLNLFSGLRELASYCYPSSAGFCA
jgi:hypothetical protein